MVHTIRRRLNEVCTHDPLQFAIAHLPDHELREFLVTVRMKSPLTSFIDAVAEDMALVASIDAA